MKNARRANENFDPARPSDDAVEPFDVFCECSQCSQGDFIPKEAQSHNPYLTFEAEQTTKTVIKDALTTVKNLRQTVRAIVQLHGATLEKRWRRKELKQRRDALLAWEPNLCPKDHPLMRDHSLAWEAEVYIPWDRRGVNRMVQMLPYINLERLVEDKVFLPSIILNRPQFDPAEFVHADARHFATSFWCGWIATAYFSGAVVMQGPRFGDWTALDLSRIHAGMDFSASKARLVFEAQQELLRFLIGVSTVILKDKIPMLHELDKPNDLRFADLASKMSERLEQAPPASKSSNVQALRNHVNKTVDTRYKDSFHSLVSRYNAAPFLAPQEFQIDRLIEITKARIVEAEDELELLQTNPNSFLRQLAHVDKYNYSHISDSSVNDRDKHWTDNVMWGMWKPVYAYGAWRHILEELEYVRDLRDRFRDSITPDQPLPRKYDIALVSLRGQVDHKQYMIRTQLWDRAAASPALRAYTQVCDDEIDPMTSTPRRVVKFKPGAMDLLTKDTMLFLYVLVTQKRANLFQYNFAHTIALLDEALSHSTRTQLNKIDPLTYSMVADLALLKEIPIACEAHRPSHTIAERSTFLKLNRPFWRCYRIFRQHYYEQNFCKTDLHGIAQLIQPVEKFGVPQAIEDRSPLQRAREAHRFLITAWQMLETELIGYVDFYGYGEVRSHYTEGLVWHKNPEFLSSCQERFDRAQAALDEKEVLQALSNMRLASADHPAGSFKAHIEGKKSKTRPSEADRTLYAHNNSGQQEEDIPSQEQTLYVVHASDSPILDHMFPKSASRGAISKTTFDWKDFASTMVKLGFGMQGIGGSKCWFGGQIQVIDQDGNRAQQSRSIIIHRPHGGAEVGPELLRDIGWRCAKHFGWCRENFAEE